MVLLFDERGVRVNQVLTASNGWYRVHVPAPGHYRLRVERIGYASTDSDAFEVAAGAPLEKMIPTLIEPIQLAAFDLSGSSRCQVRPADGVATATVWEEARKALTAVTWTSDREIYRFAWKRFQRGMDATGRRILSERRTFNRQFTSQPFTTKTTYSWDTILVLHPISYGT